MAIKSYEVTATQRFIVEFDDEMFDVQEIMNSMEFTTFPEADTYEFLDGWTDYTEMEVVENV